jgi:hypothetical protein
LTEGQLYRRAPAQLLEGRDDVQPGGRVHTDQHDRIHLARLDEMRGVQQSGKTSEARMIDFGGWPLKRGERPDAKAHSPAKGAQQELIVQLAEQGSRFAPCRSGSQQGPIEDRLLAPVVPGHGDAGSTLWVDGASPLARGVEGLLGDGHGQLRRETSILAHGLPFRCFGPGDELT